MFTIANHRLVEAQWVPSKHFSGRMEPSLIVMHESAGHITPNALRDCAVDAGTKVSWHVSIERDGTVYQHVPFDVVAWHCNPSVWEGRSNCNAFSIGIEMAGPGALTKRSATRAVAWFGSSFAIEDLEEHDSKAHGGVGLWLPPSEAQLVASRAVVAALLAAYPRITDVAGHFEISPGRKVDPSPCYPMQAVKALCADRHAPPKGETLALQTRLAALGYDPGLLDDVAGPRLRGALRAFQEQAGLPLSGAADAATRAALLDPGAVPMPTGTRPATTKADVVSIETVAVKRVSEGNAALEIVSAANQIGDAVTQAQKAKGTASGIEAVLTWLTSPAGLRSAAVLLVCAISWWAANKVDWSRVKARIGIGRS
jgi:N-acetylmuramoyl-L-alanine amidase